MRALLTVSLLLTFAIGGGGSLWWLFVASFGERQLQSASQRMAAQGYNLTYGAIAKSGFPLNLHWRVENIAIESQALGQAGEPAVQGSAAVLHMNARPWSPQSLTWRAEGAHRWAFDTEGAAGRVVATIEAASGEIAPREGQSGFRLQTLLRTVAARPSHEPQSQPLRIGSADITARLPLALDAVDLVAALQNVELPQASPFGRAVESVMLAGAISPLPRSTDAAGWAAWQAAGGKLTVERFGLRHGTLNANGEGDLALDDTLRPAGKLALRLANPQKLLEPALAEGWMQPDQQRIVAAAMQLFSGRSANGEPQLALSLAMREGALWLGPFKLAPLEPVVQP